MKSKVGMYLIVLMIKSHYYIFNFINHFQSLVSKDSRQNALKVNVENPRSPVITTKVVSV